MRTLRQELLTKGCAEEAYPSQGLWKGRSSGGRGRQARRIRFANRQRLNGQRGERAQACFVGPLMRRSSIPRYFLDTIPLNSCLDSPLYYLSLDPSCCTNSTFWVYRTPSPKKHVTHDHNLNRVVTATPLSGFWRLRTPLLFAVDILGLPRADRSNLDIFYSFLWIYSFPFFLVSDVLLSRFCL